MTKKTEKQIEISISGSGTVKELTKSLKQIINTINSTSEASLANGIEREDPTLMLTTTEAQGE